LITICKKKALQLIWQTGKICLLKELETGVSGERQSAGIKNNRIHYRRWIWIAAADFGNFQQEQ